MKERIRSVRERAKLSQAEFSKRINVAQSTLAQFETGVREPKDIHLTAICHEFGVNMEWLRFGIGNMLVNSDESALDQLVAKHHLRPMERAILEAFVKLPEEHRDGVLEYVKALVASVVADNQQYQDIADQRAARENHALREHPAFNMPADDDGEQKAHA